MRTKFDKLDVLFNQAYADIFGLDDLRYDIALDKIDAYLEGGYEATDGEFNHRECMQHFVNAYNEIKLWGLEEEVKSIARATENFFQACHTVVREL